MDIRSREREHGDPLGRVPCGRKQRKTEDGHTGENQPTRQRAKTAEGSAESVCDVHGPEAQQAACQQGTGRDCVKIRGRRAPDGQAGVGTRTEVSEFGRRAVNLTGSLETDRLGCLHRGAGRRLRISCTPARLSSDIGVGFGFGVVGPKSYGVSCQRRAERTGQRHTRRMDCGHVHRVAAGPLGGGAAGRCGWFRASGRAVTGGT